MSYYYLNEKREPVGPHSPEELSALLQQGRLKATTEVAEEGATRWLPLGIVLDELGLLPALEACPPGKAPDALKRKLPPLPKVKHLPGDCPSCGKSLEVQPAGQGRPGVELPRRCPHCGRLLNLRGAGFWRHACAPFRQYACFSGRATRAEYWCWTLFVVGLSLFSFFLMMAGAIGWAMSPGRIPEAPSSFWPALTALGGGLWLLLSVGSALPALALLVRRLHDVGRSGWWVLVWLASQLGYCLCQLGNAWSVSQQYNAAVEKNGPENWSEVLSWAVKASHFQAETLDSSFFGGMQFFLLVNYMMSLLLLIVVCTDSQRGPNQYGPSARYPLG